jgi:hypothetical protein
MLIYQTLIKLCRYAPGGCGWGQRAGEEDNPMSQPKWWFQTPTRKGGVYHTCAVAVRDGPDLLLLVTINRGPKGDIYVNLLHRDGYMPGGVSGWNPHTSRHASGQQHDKSFNRKLRVYHRLPPDANFPGIDNIVSFGVARRDARTIKEPCVPGDFDEVFEIPADLLSTAEYRTHIAVDVMEPGEKPIITPGAKIVRAHVIADRLPHVVATLFDTGPAGPLPDAGE